MLQVVEFSKISRQLVHEGGKIVSPMHRFPLPPHEISMVLIPVRGWIDPRAIIRPEGLGSVKKISNNTNGNRTRNLPAFSALLQPTAPVFTLQIVYYLLTPWSRVLLEELTGSAASQEIPHIFGTRRFLTVPTSARHLSLSWANSIQSPQLPPTSWRSILILYSHLHLGLPNGLFPSGWFYIRIYIYIKLA